MSRWALAILEAAVHSRDIDGWDDPFSNEGAWIVPAESEAVTRYVGIGWYRNVVLVLSE